MPIGIVHPQCLPAFKALIEMLGMGRWRRAYMDRINRSILQHIIQISVTILCGNVKLFRTGKPEVNGYNRQPQRFRLVAAVNRIQFHSKAVTTIPTLIFFPANMSS